MRLLNSVKTLSTIFSYSLLLFCTINFSVSNAQQVKAHSSGKSSWQTSMKRIYMFADVNDGTGNQIEYTSQGKVSIRSTVNNSILFTGQDINKDTTSAFLTSRSIHIVDPVSEEAETVEEDSIAPVETEIAVVQQEIPVSSVQQAKPRETSKTNWQANMKRIYMFTDLNDGKSDHIEYTAAGKVSIHSIANNKVLFTGQDINKDTVSAFLTIRPIYIIDPIAEIAETKKKESIVPVKPEVAATQKDFSVYPNPIDNSRKEITLGLEDFEDGKEIQVNLFNAQGIVISQQKFTLKDKQQSVALPNLTSGMYFVKVSENNTQYAKKLLVR